jgi:hypothetical protein
VRTPRPYHHHDAFQQVNLVSDIPGLAQKTEPALINPWGIAFSDTSPLWVNNQGALPGEPSKIQLYRGANGVQEDIEKLELEVDASSPTGMVFNDSEKFLVDEGQGPVPARFSSTRSSSVTLGRPAGSRAGRGRTPTRP